MLIWWQDKKTRDWKYFVLHPGAALSLSPSAVFLPLAKNNRCGLLAEDDKVMVNGVRALPFRILVDRDQISVGDERLYFSVETPIEPAVFPQQDKKVFCGRCKGELTTGERVVVCSCGTAHHDTDKLPCWKKFARCSNPQCKRPVAGFAWQPAQGS
jgi:hypothetical protein